jgi:hypothetical protein
MMTQFLDYLHAHAATRELAEELAAVAVLQDTRRARSARPAAAPSGPARIAS